MDEETLHRGLQQLIEAELLYQRGLPPQATYLFKHALIQDVAYQSLLRSTRQQYHQRIAQVVEVRFPELCETQPELVAHHYYRSRPEGAGYPLLAAGRPAGASNARPMWKRSRTSAKGLEVLATLPDTPERAQQELDLQTLLGPPLMLRQRPGGPRSRTRLRPGARTLSAGGRDPAALPGAAGLVVLLPGPSGVTDGAGAGGAPPHPGPADRGPGALLEGPCPLGNTLNCLGEFAPAQAHLEQGIALYDPQQPRHAFRYGQDPGVVCRAYAALTLWCLGYPDQALRPEPRGC